MNLNTSLRKHSARPSILFLSVALATLTLVGASCGGGTTNGGVLRSNDVAETWEFKNFVSQVKKRVYSIAGVNVHRIRIDNSAIDTMYLLTVENGIYKTDTAGDSWYQLPINSGLVRDLQIHPDDNQILFGAYNTQIIRSLDGGQTWESLYTDVQNALITRLAIDWFNPSRMYAATTLGTVLESTDSGLNWRVIHDLEGQISDLIMSPVDSRVLFITEFEKSIHRTVDGGATWVDLLRGPEAQKDVALQKFISEHPQVTNVKNISQDARRPNSLFASTAQGLMTSDDLGIHWQMMKTLIAEEAPENSLMRNITTFNDKEGYIIFTINNQIHKSIDGGTSWKTIDNYPSSQIISALVRLPKRPVKILTAEEIAAQKIAGNVNGSNTNAGNINTTTNLNTTNANDNVNTPPEIAINEEDVLFSGVQAAPKKKSSFFPTPE